MVHFVVYKQKTVMRFVEPLYPDWRILGIVTVNIQLEPVADTLRVDSGSHSFFPFVEQGQYRNPIVCDVCGLCLLYRLGLP